MLDILLSKRKLVTTGLQHSPLVRKAVLRLESSESSKTTETYGVGIEELQELLVTLFFIQRTLVRVHSLHFATQSALACTDVSLEGNNFVHELSGRLQLL